MGILSDFFLADKNIDSVDYDSPHGLPDEEFFESKGMDTLIMSIIYASLADIEYNIELMDMFVDVINTKNEGMTARLPEEFVSLLALINQDNLLEACQKCAIGTEEELAWEAADFEYLLTELSKLATVAKQKNKAIYLWVESL